jgi:hypothetical protein
MLTTISTNGERAGGGADLFASMITSTSKRVMGETNSKTATTALIPVKKVRTGVRVERERLYCPCHKGGEEVGLSGLGSS